MLNLSRNHQPEQLLFGPRPAGSGPEPISTPIVDTVLPSEPAPAAPPRSFSRHDQAREYARILAEQGQSRIVTDLKLRDHFSLPDHEREVILTEYFR